MILLLTLLLLISTQGNLIISVTPTNSEVNVQDTIDIQVLTTTPISSGTLSIGFSTDFNTLTPCLIDNVTVPCTHTLTTTAATVTLQGSLTTNTFHIITLTIINPYFASNFVITAIANGSPFSNNGLLTITSKPISCTFIPSSAIVGDTAKASLTLLNDPIPTNSVIVIDSTQQTVFKNLFVAGPICSSNTISLPCSISTSFGQQHLTISSMPNNANLSIDITSINNSPYNASLITANLQIQNQNRKNMQICTLQQPIPTTLRNSTGLSLLNWNTQVGSLSNLTLTLDTYFTPFTTQILLEVDSTFSVNALVPTTLISTSVVNNYTRYLLGGGVIVGKTLSFLVQVVNPSLVQPVHWKVLVVYSSSLFVQQYLANTLSLNALTLAVSVTVTVNKTMELSSYNTSVVLPFTLNNQPILTFTLTYGQIQCNNLNLTSNALLTVNICTTSSLSVSSPSVQIGIVWVNFNCLNHYSVRSDNLITTTITGSSPLFYSIGQGNVPIPLTINSQQFAVLNNNSTFAASTSFTISEFNIVLTQGAVRKLTINMPADLQFLNTTISSNSVGTTILNHSVTTSTHSTLIQFQGPLDITISGVSNPVKYLGTVIWNFTASDLRDNPSSFSQTTHSPIYTPTTPTASLILTDYKIQATSTLELTLIPGLQYQSAPTITVNIPNSLITTACPSCSLLSANSFSFPYTATIMKVNITVTNSRHPNNNSLSLTIATTSTIFETITLNYQLQPMTFSYLSSQTGFQGQLGSVNITVTSGPSTAIVLTYSPLTNLLSSISCSNCNNSQVIATGIVQFFQVQTITLTGTYNGIIYAQSIATVSYVCSSIQGCRVCSGAIGSMTCQQCFTSAFTPYNLLYNTQCLQSCPIATYSNTLTCINCPLNCQICDASGCLQCNINSYVYNLTCLSSCPLPLVSNATHCIPVPIICPSNCANCPLNYVCLACDSGYYLINSVCYSSCPNGYRLTGNTCELFVPPQQTSYFPFVFIISALVLMITLSAVKCYEKRSLVMGNLIAFLSIVQIGSMTMTLVYTFQSSLDLVTQALVFVLILSKVMLNAIFLIYFLKIIASEEDFQLWREQEESHQRLYRLLIALSAGLSFQTIRIIYSRLMGLRLFFGKFNTALIFKPLNFFTLAHFCTCGAALVAISVLNIIAQDGYKTSIFYSSLESIIIQGLILIACFIDNKKGYDDQFFEYQVYKVKNEFQSSHIEPIEIQEQVQQGGSMHEMLNATNPSPMLNNPKSSRIRKNPMWVRKVEEPPDLRNMEVQSDFIEDDQNQKEQTGLVKNLQQHKKESLYRRKIIEDWRKIQKQLPRHISLVRKDPKASKNTKKSISPDYKKKVHHAMRKSASLEQFQVNLPVQSGPIADRIRQYFYNLTPVAPQVIHRKRKQRKLNKNRQYQDEDEESKVATLEVERGTLSIQAEGSDRNIFNPKQDDEEGDESTNKDNSAITQPLAKNARRLSAHLQKLDEQFQDQLSDELSEEENQEGYKKRRQGLEKDLNIQFQSNPRLNQQIIVDYRYEGGDQKGRKYHTKKRRVNRMTEEVYLQRLIASSDLKKRSKHRKIDF